MSRIIIFLLCILSLALCLGCDGGCGHDRDNDGVVDKEDNCPDIANPDQLESETQCDGIYCEADGIGDACDNCPKTYNPDQVDQDADGVGDACCFSDNDCKYVNMFCARPSGICGGEGICKPLPDLCPETSDPVCACDGQTYTNDCQAYASGVSIDYKGECCAAGACGMPIPMPNRLCDDGVTMAGPLCGRDEGGSCQWMIRSCP